MQHFKLIATGYDVDAINLELDAHPELWDAHSHRTRAPGSPHNGVPDIWVRYNDLTNFVDESGQLAKPGFNDEHVPINYPAWDLIPSLKPVIFDLMAKVQGEMLGGVLITKVPPGGRIMPHRDDTWHVQYFDKIYLSLKSSPGADFFTQVDGVTERLNPKPGEAWLFDNRLTHWVKNDSPSDRITLIVCIRTGMFGRQNEH